MPRGGKRPGAGAPRGNLNAFKHGYHSKQFNQDLRTRLERWKTRRDPDASSPRELAEILNDALVQVLGQRERPWLTQGDHPTTPGAHRGPSPTP